MATPGSSSAWFKESEMLYSYVIDTVMQNCKGLCSSFLDFFLVIFFSRFRNLEIWFLILFLEFFLDEGVPEDVLLDLKATWEHHVDSSKVTNNHPSQQPKPLRNGNARDEDEEQGPGDGDSVNDEKEEKNVTGDDNGKVFARPGHNESEEITSEDDEPGAVDTNVLMDTENVLVCQFDKIQKVKGTNKFKLQLKAGIMTVNEKDYVFQRCNGDADW